jgi:H+/Cl- antiporter ClcA
MAAMTLASISGIPGGIFSPSLAVGAGIGFNLSARHRRMWTARGYHSRTYRYDYPNGTYAYPSWYAAIDVCDTAPAAVRRICE